MREILFRGKRIDNGEWVFGSLVVFDENCGNILVLHCCESTEEDPDGVYVTPEEVDMKTLGQYTGLTDKNGKKIFEGDLVRFVLPDTGELPEEVQEVVWDDKYVGFCLLLRGAGYKETFDGVPHWYVVIGNIHDNPELMGGNENGENP